MGSKENTSSCCFEDTLPTPTTLSFSGDEFDLERARMRFCLLRFGVCFNLFWCWSWRRFPEVGRLGVYVPI